MGRLTAIIAAILLAGCASTAQVQYRVVDVPAPPKIERPTLESLNIHVGMSLEQIVQTFRADIKKLQATIMQHETALDVYRKKDAE